MNWLDAAVLGVIQGIGEFLPISSSGHLVLSRVVLGPERVPQDLAFDALLHLATAISVVLVFRAEVAALFRGARGLLQPASWRAKWSADADFRTLVLVVLSALPALVAGLILKHFLEGFRERAAVVSPVLIVTGLWLLVASRFPPGTRDLGVRETLAMGFAQMVSLLVPGFSRSGATIGTGLLCGARRELVGPFAFIMALVPNVGAAILKGKDLLHRPDATSHPGPILLGAGVALVVGVGALRWLLPFVRRGSLRPFGWYCLFVGILATGHVVFHVY